MYACIECTVQCVRTLDAGDLLPTFTAHSAQAFIDKIKRRQWILLKTAMIDSIGGSGKVNNMLSTLNIAPINKRNLQDMERRAGRFVESVAQQSIDTAAQETFQKEMSEISQEESKVAAASMECLIEDLGIAALPDTSPATKSILQSSLVTASMPSNVTDSADTPSPLPRRHRGKCRPFGHGRSTTIRKNLLSKYKAKSRYGMSCSADTAWQKRGFDSLTSHTFFMSSSKMGKKIVKSVISHRQCSTCNWWRRHRPGQPLRQHRCVRNHSGSARSMESESGEKAILDLAKAGTPVEILEGDGDNTLLARLKSKHGISLKKKYDKNHVIKNLGKSLYGLQNEKGIKISKISISHIQKCVSYALSKNSGDLHGLQENLRAIIPHNFGDHQLCQPRFCGYLRNKDVTYVHRSLPYKSSLTGETLRKRLEDIMTPFIAKASQLIELGSSQQCEHANREVSLKAPKNIYYGGTEALDFRVQATAAFINEGRNYIVELLRFAVDSYIVWLSSTVTSKQKC
ncbi:uncharacterized protein LOC123555937 isoform X3 [Mercenaria mercenaria]|uniref:uncharacterized protein LOC123555937 isoform X3 n=1 Tax=Mercenaria mercenaria TaxID=6596 RepID=UPI00234F27B4|nr:uncharacterized protein LOC123555937 isoform X3 [Mercenaria mercenaria]